MSRLLHVGAAQVGPIYKEEKREDIVERMIDLLEEAALRKVELLCYPECSLSTFFPRWHLALDEVEKYFDKSMPNPPVQPLFDRAKELRIGFCLGYSELDGDRHYNTSILVGKDGKTIGKYRKSHVPGTKEPTPRRKLQHFERRYYLEGDTGFKVWPAFGGYVGMAICYDRRWPETWRVMGMQGVELVLVGWNTPYYRLAEFHNRLSLQAGCYQNNTWAVGAAHCGEEEPGYVLMGQSMIVSPLGEVVAMSHSLKDELIDATIDLDATKDEEYLFNFEVYRRPDLYKIISERKGVILPT